jgi:multidrug efflux pump subunit AcrB
MVKELWYQVRKKVGDTKPELPAGVVGPNFNDEYGDVYSTIYMLTADGLSLAELKARAENVRQRLLRVANVNKVDLIGDQPEKIFLELSNAKLATLGLTPQQIFDSVAKQNSVASGGSVDTSADRINLRVTGAFSGVEAIAAVPVQATSLLSSAATRTHHHSSCGRAAIPRSASASRCRTAPTSWRSARI